MRNLKFAILGLLNQKNMTGYDLMKEFESTLNEFWHAKHSQIYPELKKLCNEECISYSTIETNKVLDKKLYSITSKGKEEFNNWLLSDSEIPNTPKDITRLKIFYSNILSAKEKNELYTNVLYQHKERLKHLKNNQLKFDKKPSPTDTLFGDYLVLIGAIMREEMMIEWLNKCIELNK